MKKLFILIVALLISSPGYAQTTLGTSSSATSPERSGDATTGLFSSTAGAVSVSSAGTEMMRVNGTGIGIGTSTPGYLLDLNLGDTGNVRLLSDSTSVDGFISSPYGNLVYSSNAYYNASNLYYEKNGPASLIQISGTAGEILFDTAPSGTAGNVATFTPMLTIANNGNVGIGTLSPANVLDIGNSGGIHITSGVPSSTSGALYNSSGTLAWNGGLVISSGGQLRCSGSNCSNSTGSSTIQYCPYKGNTKTTASQGNYTIPSTCLTATLTSMYVGGVSGSSVSASTLYYIYLWNASGTWVLDAETTGHVTDSSTGIEIKSGDNTKTLVGMIHTDASKHVMTGGETNVQGDTNTVATWDNRIPTKTYCGFTASRQIHSATLIEINSENRCLFMSWADAAQFSSQLVTHAGGATLVETQITLDGTSTSISILEVFSDDSQGGGYGFNVLAVAPAVFVPAEGYHYTETLGMSGTQYATYPYGPSNVFTIQ